MKIQYRYLLFFLMMPCLLLAHNGNMNGKYTKEKKIEREFSVKSGATLDVSNSYGNVDITTWNQNRIEITVTIKTNGDNEEQVKRRLEEIDVDFTSTNLLVTAKTTFERRRSSWNIWSSGSSNVSMEINYLIKMPKSNNIEVTNSYGAISLTALNGNAGISSNYGKFILGELNGDSNQLNFAYTNNSTIGYVKNAAIKSNYSGFTIDKAQQVALKGNYNKVEIKEATNLTYNCDYGKIDIGKVKDLSGKGNYVTATIETVTNNLSIHAGYGKLTVGNLDRKINKVVIFSRYTSIQMGYDANANFDLSVNLSYANLRGKDAFDFSLQSEQGTRKEYQGTFGKKNSGNSIAISSDYGGVSLIKK